MTGLAFFVITAGVIYAAMMDIRWLKIPNALHIWMLGLLPLVFAVDPAFQSLMRDDAVLRLVVAGLLLLVGFGLFARGLLGGGDAKLLAVLGLWLPSAIIIHWLVLITLYGAVLGAVLLICARLPLPVWLEGVGIGKGIRLGQPRMPYALPIAFATITVLVMFDMGVW